MWRTTSQYTTFVLVCSVTQKWANHLHLSWLESSAFFFLIAKMLSSTTHNFNSLHHWVLGDLPWVSNKWLWTNTMSCCLSGSLVWSKACLSQRCWDWMGHIMLPWAHETLEGHQMMQQKDPEWNVPARTASFSLKITHLLHKISLLNIRFF